MKTQEKWLENDPQYDQHERDAAADMLYLHFCAQHRHKLAAKNYGEKMRYYKSGFTICSRWDRDTKLKMGSLYYNKCDTVYDNFCQTLQSHEVAKAEFEEISSQFTDFFGTEKTKDKPATPGRFLKTEIKSKKMPTRQISL